MTFLCFGRGDAFVDSIKRLRPFDFFREALFRDFALNQIAANLFFVVSNILPIRNADIDLNCLPFISSDVGLQKASHVTLPVISRLETNCRKLKS